MNSHTLLVFTALLLALTLTAGCGKKEDAKAATQVAARVDGDEITVHQVNYILARSQNVAPELAEEAKREVLDKLIDQHLAKQKAIESKLDRSPDVMQAIEAARREILANAYVEQITAGLRRPAPVETHDYYVKHPELFAKRRMFDLEELAFVAEGATAAGLREQVSKGGSMQEIASWLQSQGIKFAANRGIRAAEQIPLEILPRVQAMKEGQIQLFEAGGRRYQVIRVVASKAAPVDEATATPRIRQFLSNQNSREVISKEMKKLRKNARIEYAGEFAGGTAASPAKVKVEGDARPASEELSGERSQK